MHRQVTGPTRGAAGYLTGGSGAQRGDSIPNSVLIGPKPARAAAAAPNYVSCPENIEVNILSLKYKLYIPSPKYGPRSYLIEYTVTEIDIA